MSLDLLKVFVGIEALYALIVFFHPRHSWRSKLIFLALLIAIYLFVAVGNFNLESQVSMGLLLSVLSIPVMNNAIYHLQTKAPDWIYATNILVFALFAVLDLAYFPYQLIESLGIGGEFVKALLIATSLYSLGKAIFYPGIYVDPQMQKIKELRAQNIETPETEQEIHRHHHYNI